jgi:hypothetical protein
MLTSHREHLESVPRQSVCPSVTSHRSIDVSYPFNRVLSRGIGLIGDPALGEVWNFKFMATQQTTDSNGTAKED